MAYTRKLQGEIDRCLKKVTEGVEQFEDIWQKLHNASNTNQKEKYEADLKKEIKKLQRQRDQIKTWMQSNDIKDKRILMDNRKLIETQMERFKVVERETKTKAYSKEGLGGAMKVDPKEKEKDEVTNWLSTQITELNLQIDQFESETESLSTGKKKKDKDKAERLEDLKKWLERHRFHIKKLEALMRMVDNDAVDTDQVGRLKDDIEYYVESNQEPEFEENEFIYDDLDFDDLIGVNINLATSPSNESAMEEHFNSHVGTPMSSTTTNSNSSPSPSPCTVTAVNHSNKEDVGRKRLKSENVAEDKAGSSQLNKSNSSTSSNTSVSSTSKVPPQTPTKHSQQNGASGSMSNPLEGISSHPAASAPPSSQPYSQAAGAHNHTAGVPSILQRPPHSQGPQFYYHHPRNAANFWLDTKALVNHAVDHSGASMGNSSGNVIVNNSTQQLQQQNSTSSTTPTVGIPNNHDPHLPPQTAPSPGLLQPPQQPAPLLTQQLQQQQQLPMQSSAVVSSHHSLSNNSLQQQQNKVIMNGPSLPGAPHNLKEMSEAGMSLKSMAQQAVQNAGLNNNQSQQSHQGQQPSIYNTSGSLQGAPSPAGTDLSRPAQGPTPPSSTPSSQQQQSTTTTIHLNPLLGVAPLGPQSLSKEHCYQLAMLEAAYHHLPHPSDSERLRLYLPRNPCPTPAYYPQIPPPHSDTVEFFQRLSVETLFFIFYYMEGTKAQYLAAKALKKQSWRFHTKYMMWFQRHEEPKTITEDYEQGTYVYFDYEKWGQRKKEGFTFEYRFLEDRELN